MAILGRPPRDLIKLANDLIKWSLLHDSINLNGFCGQQNLAPSVFSRYARENEDFCLAYEEAKANLADRREKMLNAEMLHVKAYDLNACVYDHFLKEERREQAKEASKEQSKNQTFTIVVPHGLATGSDVPTAPISN